MEPEEARLLACLAANLDAHFAELVTAYQHRLYVFVLRQTGSVQDAEDIVQETFLQAYFALGNYPGWRVRTLRLQAWLYRIALHLFYSPLRSPQPLLVLLCSEEGRLASFTAEACHDEQPKRPFVSP